MSRPLIIPFSVKPKTGNPEYDDWTRLITCSSNTAKVKYSFTLKGKPEAIDPNKSTFTGETPCTEAMKVVLISPILTKGGALYGISAGEVESGI